MSVIIDVLEQNKLSVKCIYCRNRELNLIKTTGVCVFTWHGSVGLCVCRRPSGRGFRVLTCSQSCRSFIFLQLCHPGHRPLTVHMFKLLNLFSQNHKSASESVSTLSLSQPGLEARSYLCEAYLFPYKWHHSDASENVLPRQTLARDAICEGFCSVGSRLTKMSHKQRHISPGGGQSVNSSEHWKQMQISALFRFIYSLM